MKEARPVAQRSQPRVLALAICALLLAVGCQSLRYPRIDGSGQRIFLPADSATAQVVTIVPGVPLVTQRATIAPREIIAPVGSEVVLQAGIDGQEPSLLSGQRIEWMLSPESAGDFVTLDGRDNCSLFRFPRDRPRKVTNKFVIGETLVSPINLTRGTPTPTDDLTINSGRTWVSVSSPTEGTSQVTAFAPSVTSWDQRTAVSTIHWVDSQWILPPPAINPVGTKHTLTTSVTRQTDSTPIIDWQVRYEILGGPPAGFAPGGDQVLIVPTDANGQASIEIQQLDAQAGTNRIGIQIIRPAIPNTARSKSLVVGSGTTTKTWTSPDLALRVAGPAQTSLGANATYTIEVTNPGDLPTSEVTVVSQVPQGASFVSSNPQGSVAGAQLQWPLRTLAPRETRQIQVTLRAEQRGTINFCAEVRSAEGLSASNCATTTVSVPQLEASLTGPQSAAVGSTVRYRLLVTNRSAVPATGLTIRDEYDAGLEHMVAKSPIERDLGDIAPGQTREIFITLRVVQPGRWCQRVTVTGNGGLNATTDACVQAERIEVQPEPEIQPTPVPRGPLEPSPAIPTGQPAMEVEKTGPRRLQVGEKAEFFINVRNTGEVPLTNVRIVDGYELALDPVNATDGFTVGREELIWVLPLLEVGRSYRLQVNCACVAPAARACNRVTVTSNEHSPIADDACVEIVAKPQPAAPVGQSKITVTIAGLDNPIAVGGKARYRVFVKNDGTAADRNVRLVIDLPAQMEAVADGTRARVRASFPPRRIVFEPVAELRAGEPLSFEFQTEAKQAGNATIAAEVSSDNLQQPLRAAEQTEVLGR